MAASNPSLTGDTNAARVLVTPNLTTTVPGTALDATQGKALKDFYDALSVLVGGKLAATLVGAANGLAPLDGTGKVASAFLPSYVDDVVEVPTVAALPLSGESGKIYVILATNKQFRWGGSAYVELVAAPGSTDAVPEGSANLYFTPSRVAAAMSQALADLGTQIALKASLAQLASLTARVAAIEAGTPAPPPSGTYVGSVGDTVYFPLPAGTLATIQVLRNGVAIPGAVSAPNSNSYAYVLVQADDQQPLSVALSAISYDTTAARRFSIEITNAKRDTVTIVFDKTMQLSAVSLVHFALGGLLVNKTLLTATVSNNVLELKYSSDFAFVDAPTLTLTQNGSNDLCDYAGNLVPVFSNLAIANNIEQGAVPISLFSINGGDYGFVIQNGNVVDGPSADHSFMVAALINTDNVTDWLYGDGWFEFQCPDVSDVQRHVTLNPDRDNRNQYQHKYELIFFSGGVLAATYVENGGGFAAFETHTFSSGAPLTSRWARLRRLQGVVTAEFSEDNKTTWTVFHTFVNDEVDPLYPRFAILQAGSVLNKPALAGFVPEGTVET